LLSNKIQNIIKFSEFLAKRGCYHFDKSYMTNIQKQHSKNRIQR